MKSFLSVFQLKIASGYILLLALLSIVVFLVRLEYGKMENLDSREYQINMKRKAVNRTFKKLLEVSFHDHFPLMQGSMSFREYSNNCVATLVTTICWKRQNWTRNWQSLKAKGRRITAIKETRKES